MEPTKFKVNTKSDPLKVRKEPNGDPTGISKEKGSLVLVTDIKDGWAKIDEGWVSERFLLEIQEGDSVSAVPPPVVAFKEGRAPWMKIVLEEANHYGGFVEGSEPLKSRVQSAYFSQGLESADSSTNPHEVSWCASFASWCLKTAGYSNPRSQRALEFDPDYVFDAKKDRKSGMRRIKEPVYGCIIVWKNKTGPGGHVSFYYGKNANGQIIALGGNQGNSIQFSTRNPDGDTHQSIVGYFLPENYADNEKDNFTADDLKLVAGNLNASGILAVNGKDSLLT